MKIEEQGLIMWLLKFAGKIEDRKIQKLQKLHKGLIFWGLYFSGIYFLGPILLGSHFLGIMKMSGLNASPPPPVIYLLESLPGKPSKVKRLRYCLQSLRGSMLESTKNDCTRLFWLAKMVWCYSNLVFPCALNRTKDHGQAQTDKENMYKNINQ